MKKNHWNITAPNHLISQIKTSKYFKQDLGRSHTVIDTNKGERELREGTFTTWYYNNYKSLIIKTGYIGLLHFYIDHYMKMDILGFFLNVDLNKHQYVIKWDQDKINDIGIDSWISIQLMLVDDTLNNNNNDDNEGEEDIIIGDGNKLRTNPGGVSWKDIEDHYNKKKYNR